ncbi:atherin-like [Herpailurus yagouaroundi]|uniref:atherin-like n=1 Tax=Herpailurus yagouaroundi TaxID=1608482 RepID=UPI001AD6E4C4|nr:atherin-like [Puma yagouaroundi]
MWGHSGEEAGVDPESEHLPPPRGTIAAASPGRPGGRAAQRPAPGPRHHVTRALVPRSPACSRAQSAESRSGQAASIHLAHFPKDKRGSSYFRASLGQLGADQKPQAEETQAPGVSAHGGRDPLPQALRREAGHPPPPTPGTPGRLPAPPPDPLQPTALLRGGPRARPRRTETVYPAPPAPRPPSHA